MNLFEEFLEIVDEFDDLNEDENDQGQSLFYGIGKKLFGNIDETENRTFMKESQEHLICHENFLKVLKEIEELDEELQTNKKIFFHEDTSFRCVNMSKLDEFNQNFQFQAGTFFKILQSTSDEIENLKLSSKQLESLLFGCLQYIYFELNKVISLHSYYNKIHEINFEQISLKEINCIQTDVNIENDGFKDRLMAENMMLKNTYSTKRDLILKTEKQVNEITKLTSAIVSNVNIHRELMINIVTSTDEVAQNLERTVDDLFKTKNLSKESGRWLALFFIIITIFIIVLDLICP
eukprot:TRINITY_DN1709_c0_g1_i1.p1 TRINITY_DN1709_c0_g1~~TRINITY_DN1709_c0_g1_i1.p1  ORF type:complete len:293 (+),score=92.21 TRINITY_DN1709_c0_g1_i1:32-910(+)